MARYIDADLLLERIYPYNGVDKSKYAINAKAVFEAIRKSPTADVVPKSEAEQWYHEYHAIKDELKQEKMYHRATEKLADRYCAELQTAKSEVAREIFAEIESVLFHTLIVPTVTAIGIIENKKIDGLHIRIEDYNTIKKKYTEGETDGNGINKTI